MLLFLLVVKGIFEPSPGESELLSKTTFCKFQVSESTHPDSRSTKAFSAVSNKGWSTLPLRDGTFRHGIGSRELSTSQSLLGDNGLQWNDPPNSMLISCYIPIGLFDTPHFCGLNPLYTPLVIPWFLKGTVATNKNSFVELCPLVVSSNVLLYESVPDHAQRLPCRCLKNMPGT